MSNMKLLNPTPEAKAAVLSGAVEGDVYGDGEVWVNLHSYTEWTDRFRDRVTGAEVARHSV